MYCRRHTYHIHNSLYADLQSIYVNSVSVVKFRNGDGRVWRIEYLGTAHRRFVSGTFA